ALCQPPPDRKPAAEIETTRGFSGVGVNTIDDLRSLILEGPRDQVEAMLRVIDQIDRLSLGADPDIQVVELKAADSEAMAVFLNRVYESRATAKVGAATTGGKVGFIPIASPNAVVVVAPPVDLEEAVEFVRQVDGERGKAAAYFRVFRLETAPAAQVQAKLTQFFSQREDGAGLRLRAEVVADERTNSVLVYAGPADLAQAAALIKQLDADENGATSDLRIFPLQNAVATELAVLLQQAVVYRGLSASGTAGAGGTTGGQQQPQNPGGFNQNRGGGAAGQSVPPTKSARLRLLTTDADGQAVESGILEDISVTADERSNSLLVTAPPRSMSLMAELIARFDDLPSPASDLKVFSLRYSDAATLVETLRAVFLGTTQGTTGGFPGQNPGVGAGAQGSGRGFLLGETEAELVRVPVTFATDQRTNSIIVTGSRNDLLAVEAIILRLDSSSALERKTTVYKLRNLTAVEAATALTNFLTAQDALALNQDGRIALADQISREVTVVAEAISNSLIIGSSPRFYDEILRIVEQIDVRPPQVVI
ncbi:MAG: secretin N-terminal domain-containing protein, partial [Planctomycetia bacterium]